MKRFLVYTCITNDYDWLLPPVWTSSSFQFICFTDDPRLRVHGWEMRPLPSVPEISNGTLANRYCKFFPWKILPDHDWSVYIDANIRLVSDPSKIISEMEELGLEMAIPAHPHRSNIWQEAEACKRLKKIPDSDHLVLDAQILRYQEYGLPKSLGLTENSIIFRSGDLTRIMPAMEIWWEELKQGVQRDQISLPYVLWMTGTKIHRLPFSVRNENLYFRIVPHRNNRGLYELFYKYVYARRYHSSIWSFFFRIAHIANTMRHYAMIFFRY